MTQNNKNSATIVGQTLAMKYATIWSFETFNSLLFRTAQSRMPADLKSALSSPYCTYEVDSA